MKRFLIFIFSLSMTMSCKHRTENSATKDVELRQASTGETRVVYQDGGKVFLKGCEPGTPKGPDGFYTRNECGKDLGIEPLSLDTYQKRLFDFLKFEPIEKLEQDLVDLDRDLKELQRAQLEERAAGQPGGNTFIQEIKAIEDKISDLQARLVVSKTRKEQVERIIKSLEATSNARLYFPGIDYNAALAPFGGNVGGVVVVGSCNKRNGVDMVFCDIPRGSFTMGSPQNEEGRDSDESPQHQVTLSKDVEMLATEVTQAMWQAVMGSNPSKFKDSASPVEQVSWNDITNDFLPKLNEKLRSEGYTYRLPTEAEWEYAARGEKAGPFGIDGDLKDFGWFDGNSGGKTNPVGKLKSNKYGLFDMHGNVWEWVQDAKADYSSSAVTDPLVTAGSNRVIRGGSWIDDARICRSAYRNGFGPVVRFSVVGFRLVRTR